jgi:hypothetical protein
MLPRKTTLKTKIKLILVMIALILSMASCDDCTNCNPQGTPYPTLSPMEWPGWKDQGGE